MKNLFLSILLLCFFGASAQTNDTTKYFKSVDYGWRYQRVKAELAFIPPTDTVGNKNGFVSLNGNIYLGNGSYWTSVSAVGYKLASDSFFTSGYTTMARTKQLTDSMSGTLTKYTDTASMLATRVKYSDTANIVANRFKISDTSYAHSNYLRKSDTATMLSPYLHFQAGVKYYDTATMLSNRLKISDTANAFSNYLRKTTLILPAEGGTGYTSLTSLAGDAAFTVAFQAKATNLTSLAGLSYASTSFVKMTAAGTFALDVNTYLTTSSASSTYIPLAGSSSSVPITGNLVFSNNPYLYSNATSGGAVVDAGIYLSGATKSIYFQVNNTSVGIFNSAGSFTLGSTSGTGTGALYAGTLTTGANIQANQTSNSAWIYQALNGSGVTLGGFYRNSSGDGAMYLYNHSGVANVTLDATSGNGSFAGSVTAGTGLSGQLTATINNISIGTSQYTPLVGGTDDGYMKIKLYDGGSSGLRGGFGYGYDDQGNFGSLNYFAQTSHNFLINNNTGNLVIFGGSYSAIYTTMGMWYSVGTGGKVALQISDGYNGNATPYGQIFNSAVHEYALGYGSTSMTAGTAVLKWNTSGNVTVAGTFGMKGYTVGTLPTGVTGAWAYVTDASGPTYGATVVGGGSVVTPVFYNGSNWTCR